ncbi:MAG: arylsulfatase [Acidobacteria bacterium]|nr:arylsulfatase [Acidobacteriota bacterium]
MAPFVFRDWRLWDRLVGMRRREFLAGLSAQIPAQAKKPNIVFVLLDDLGYADVGCYGQKKILTPHIDSLALAGTRMTEAYAGGPVCAPSRCVLMTGMHGGHARIRSNAGTAPIGPEDKTFPAWLKARGYVCGGFGKWGLGDVGSAGVPWKHGFDTFFGYLHQVHAHSYFPDFLWENDKRVPLGGKTYSADLIADKSFAFLRENRGKPFFLYATYTVPHGRYETPDVKPYQDRDWPEGEKKYAAMVSQGDRYAGRILEMLREFGLERDTLVIFASDNGGVRGDGHELATFETMRLRDGVSLRGQKGTLYEGGIRVPMLLRWPGRVKAGAVSDTPVYFADIFATVMDAVDGKTKTYGDGVSIFESLKQPSERTMVWEDHRWVAATKELRPDYGIAVRIGNWKAVRERPGAPLQVFDLMNDPGETKDISATCPMTAKLAEAMRTQRSAPLRHEGDMQFVK